MHRSTKQTLFNRAPRESLSSIATCTFIQDVRPVIGLQDPLDVLKIQTTKMKFIGHFHDYMIFMIHRDFLKSTRLVYFIISMYMYLHPKLTQQAVLYKVY